MNYIKTHALKQEGKQWNLKGKKLIQGFWFSEKNKKIQLDNS